MSFISLNFVTLFVCTFLLYYTLPPKYRKAILLLSSCIFIGYYHIAFLIIALLISLATFFLGKWVGQSKHEKDAKRIYISGLCFLITGWVGIPICQPPARRALAIPLRHLLLYLSGPFIPDGNLLERRRTGREPCRLHDIYALFHEIPVRTYRTGERYASTIEIG